MCMAFHVIGEEIIVLDQKAEVRISLRHLHGLGDDAIPSRQALLAGTAPEKIEVRDGNNVHVSRLGQRQN